MMAAQQLDLVEYIAGLHVPPATVPDHVLQLLPRRPAHWRRRVADIAPDDIRIFVCPSWTGVVVDVLRTPDSSDMLLQDGNISHYDGGYPRRYRLVLMSPEDAMALNERWPLLPTREVAERYPLLKFATTDAADTRETQQMLHDLKGETA